jgi:hypothetical protein
MTKKFLEVICKQHEAFKFQTGTFIDTVYEFKNNIPNFDYIKNNIKEIYYLSFRITSLLEESKKQVSGSRYNPGNRLPFGSKFKQTGMAPPPGPQPLFSDKTNLDGHPDMKKNLFPKITGEFLLNDVQKDKMSNQVSNIATKRRLTPENHNVQETDLKQENFHLQKEYLPIIFDSRKNFENEIEKTPSNANAMMKFENSIYEENTFFKNNEFLNIKSQNLSTDMNLFNENSLLVSRSISKNFDFNIFEQHHVKENGHQPLYSKKSISNSGSRFDKNFFRDKEYKYSNNYRCDRETRLSKRQRGTYKICAMEIKNEAIRLTRLHSLKEASEILNIPEKNIKRWLKNGPERKKGAGRKTMDPVMENRLLNWISDEFKKTNTFPDCRDVKFQAKIFSTNSDFKASKGWCDKFMRRNHRLFDNLNIGKKELHHDISGHTEC